MEGKNPQKTVAVVWLIIAAVMLVVMIAPWLMDADMMSWGYGVSMVALIMLITALVVTWMYFSRAATLERMLSGDGLLARWSYQDDEWSQYTEEEFERQKKAKLGTFGLVAGIMLLVGVGFFIFEPHGGRYVLLTMLGIGLIIGSIVFVVPRINYARNRRAIGQSEQGPEVLISPSAVYLNRSLHAWNSFGGRLENVRLQQGTSWLIEITYSYPSRHGRQNETIHVPVPRRHEREAQSVVEALQRR